MAEDKNQWYLLHRIIHHARVARVIRFPKNNQGPGVDSDVVPEKGPKRGSQLWIGYAFVLSYNTDLGQEDPDVIKLLQSGKSSEDQTCVSKFAIGTPRSCQYPGIGQQV